MASRAPSPLAPAVRRTKGERPRERPVTSYRLETSDDWRAAADALTARGCPYDAALAQLGGDIAAVKQALATFRRLGARAAARRARQRLAMTGGRPSSRRADTCANPHGLTRRERDVLELLAKGHRDADIAAILFIRPKTVSNHVSAILTKLGVQNRIHRLAAALTPPAAKPRNNARRAVVRRRSDRCVRITTIRSRHHLFVDSFGTYTSLEPVREGLEPPRPKTRAPKARASANFATRA